MKSHWDGKVRLIRSPQRLGLMRARMLGAENASGQVIVFLDSHCEVNVDWLPPLVEPIASSHGDTVTIPIIDIIQPDTFKYVSSPMVKGGFNWGLHYKWDNIPRSLLRKPEDFVRPIASPTMAGGLFAIQKDTFFQLGGYDPGMDIWGGENLELSFKIWMCLPQGRLVIVPCSRVGHVFRGRRPYGSPDGTDTMLKNSLRVAHVWMDEYKVEGNYSL
ncbi:unnamed protein product [Darwinula stevensoni]|uniref:Glycosyltransferase 2-like domain-containing protein n=1 Tax=Darwinula stevensoni TaxID=69355 RepID=A0A7R9A282_9CRUS|nr:unnamed protein product [Darwinula stevensoni]CAG0878994.1 unnamed protein product [Darwinula stevensoni]